MNILAFDIGGTKCAVMLAKAEEETITFLKRTEVKTTDCWKDLLNELINEGSLMLKEYSINKGSCRIGVSCGGPLDIRKGLILSPPNLPGWDEVPIVKYLEDRLGMPARLKNDADACALAEWRYGAGKGTKHMIFLTFGTGLGAGLILNGRLYEGASGMAGEVGHIRLSEEGPVGYGKTGSFEGFCSGGGIKQLAQRKAIELMALGNRASFHKDTIEEITAKAVAEAAVEGHRDALEVYRASGKHFGRGLSILIDILNPEVIVVGSIYVRAKEYLIDAMKESINEEALESSRKECRIEASQLGEQIGDYGAVVAAMD